MVGKRSTRSRAPAHARGDRARTLRIIGGTFRSRRLRFPPRDIRPTPDRVRETLFNWLAPRVVGARCLDLFAGSGALGLEALSRGAATCVFVERDRIAAAELARVLSEWGMQGGAVRSTDALRFLADEPQPFDIVFLDPPFTSRDLLEKAASRLEAGWLAPGAAVYVENAARDGQPVLPQAWKSAKSGRAGEVGYHLFTHEA